MPSYNYENVPFPSHDINPAEKTGKWLLQAAKSSFGKSYNYPIFYGNRDKYEEYRSYGLGKQTIDRYKPVFSIDEKATTSSMNVSWETRPFASKFRDVGISRMFQVERNIICTPIDPLAQSKADTYFKEMRVKILMRDALEQINPELAQKIPHLQPSDGEPQNMEELKMQINFGFKFNLAMEAEMAINLGFYQNSLAQKRMQCIKDLWDIGVAGYKDELNDNGNARFRECDPSCVIMSYCKNADFSDKIYCGEIKLEPVASLKEHFTNEQMKKIEAAAISGQAFVNNDYDNLNERLNVEVLHLEVKTWNKVGWERYINKYGNKVVKDARYEDFTDEKKSKLEVDVDGKIQKRFYSKTVECWYKISWIIGTDLYYNEGKVLNQKNPKDDMSSSESSYHFQAVNFHNMKAQGMMERLKPIIDEFQLTILNIQDFKNKWLPYIAEIDFDAIESVAFGDGNSVWTPEKILETVFRNRALVKRGRDIANYNINGKAVEIHTTGMAAELTPLMNDLERLKQEARDVTGLNESTDASGAPERKGKFVSQLEEQATNNALYPMMFAEKMLLQSLAKGVLMRQIQAVKYGNVEGIATSLGDNTVKFIKVTPDIKNHIWSIKIEDRPTNDEINMLMEQMGLAQSSDLLEPQDISMIKSMDNIKQMEQMLAYRVSKRKEERRMEAMQNTQQAGQVQQQSAIVSSEEKRKEIQLEYDLKLRNDMAIKDKELEIAKLKLMYEARNTDVAASSRVESNLVVSDAKIQSALVAKDEGVEKAHIVGMYGAEKQRMANEKKPEKTS